jgi:hypothetical protein
VKKHLLLCGALLLVALAAAPAAAQAACATVNTSRGTFTAAYVNADLTGDVDGTGCDIAAYYDDGAAHTVSAADVHGSLWYGADVAVTDSDVHDIGDTPFNGVQRGLAILFGNTAGEPVSGTVDGNDVFDYQKNGITATHNTTIDVTDNTVTGFGKVEFIAQNGIQVSSGATPEDFAGNVVTGNHYSGPSKPTVATGILLFGANIEGRDVGRISSSNDVNHNQSNIATSSSDRLAPKTGRPATRRAFRVWRA